MIILSTFFPSCLLHSATIDQSVNEYLAPVSNFVASIVFYSVEFGDYSFPFIVVWLIIAAIYCTFYFGFINVKGFGTALGFLTSKKKKKKCTRRSIAQTSFVDSNSSNCRFR